MTRRRAAILAAAAALFWLCRGAYYPGFFNDDAFYFLGAKSLLAGRYAESALPGAPLQTHFMPGWPLLLAPALAVSGSSPAAAQAFALLLLVAALALLARVVEAEDGAATADLTIAWAAAAPLLASTAATLLADGPLLFCAAAALAALPRALARRDSGAWLAYGAALGFAALVRPTGLAIAASVALVLLLERRRREAALALGAACAVLGAWLLRGAALSPGGWTYLDEASNAARAGGLPVLSNAWFYARELFGRALLRPPVGGLRCEIASAVAGAFLAAAGLRGLRSPAARAAFAFAGFYALPHLLWARTPAARYLIPLVPLAAWAMLRGRGKFRAAAFAVGLLASLAATGGVVRASIARSAPQSRPPLAAAAWLKSRAPAGAILAAEYDARWELLTGFRCVHLAYDARTPGALAAYLRETRASFVIVEDTGFALKPAGGPYAVPAADEIRALLLAGKKAGPVFSDGAGVEVWDAR